MNTPLSQSSVNPDTIGLIPLRSLLGLRFEIPAYQRGYRWGKDQVQALLKDVWEFQPCGDGDSRSFYCLQPVVVKLKADANNTWEVVDGQQRLTTILLILKCLQHETTFTLCYETRKDSEDYLRSLGSSKADSSKAIENIDYHFISSAYNLIIKPWFESKTDSERQCFLNRLLDDTRVIWYHLPTEAKAVEVFTRLNVGKIPLTNAELIRALFLRSGNFTATSPLPHQLKLALEWDTMEKALQADEFWYFLNRGAPRWPSRIELIFNLIAEQEGEGVHPKDEHPLRTFELYNKRFTSKEPKEAWKPDEAWKQVKHIFQTLEEWFNDLYLYHLIGYLIAQGDKILDLLNAAQGVAKRAFRKQMKIRIRQRLGLPGEIKMFIDGLKYGDPKVRSTLLLFNIATMLQHSASNLLFPFDRFKKDAWDIEHVRSVASEPPETEDSQREWLETMQEYMTDEDLKNRLSMQLDTKPWAVGDFAALYDDLLKTEADDTTNPGEEGDDADDSIGNLALLDQGTNRSYKNELFPVKRGRIIALDKQGIFVPLCTRNVFLKLYSKQVDTPMRWGPLDREAYKAAIIQTLSNFFAKQGGAE